MVAPANSAPGLISGLGQIGAVLDRQDESHDNSNIYNETYQQYQDTRSQASQAASAGEQQQLETQVASYKQQLNELATEAGNRVILLRLEQK
jgi:hypothetical protein